MAAQLEHPSAIRVLELGLEHDRPYAVLEWVGVTTLATSVAANGPKSRHEAMAIAGDLAAALKAAHRLGLPHGRLAPGQVLLLAEPNPSSISAAPWSGSRPRQNRSDADGRALLNLARMAAARAADLYSLGACSLGCCPQAE